MIVNSLPRLSMFMLVFFLIYESEPGFTASIESDYRLFTTIDQRRALDDARRNGGQQIETIIKPTVNESLPKLPPQISLRGFVQRDSAHNTVWTNKGSTLNPSSLDPDIYINTRQIHDSKVPITIGGETIKLKPGQGYAGSDQRVREFIEIAPDSPNPSVNPSISKEPSLLPPSLGQAGAAALLDKATRTILPVGSPP